MIEIKNMKVVKLATFPTEGSYIGLSIDNEVYSILTEEPINAAVYKLTGAESITLQIELQESKIITIVNGETYEIDGLVVMYSSIPEDSLELSEDMRMVG